MTQHEKETVDQIPSLEPWLKVAIAAFIPMTAAFMVHADVVPYMFGAGGALTITSLVMLMRQERGQRR